MIETNSSFKDSGYDCEHCGGEILKRTDRETGQPDRVCFQCRQCGCQWTPEGELIRLGGGPNCLSAARGQPVGEVLKTRYNRRLLLILGVIATVIIVRFGGLAALRLIVPLALIGVLGWYFVRLAQQQRWW